MSATPRTYMRWGQAGGFSGGPRHERDRALKVVAAGAAVFVVYVFWISRDTNPAGEFIASDQRIQVVVPDMMKHRERMAGAPVWPLISASAPIARAHELLREDFGFPEWMLRNLVGGDVIVSGKDVETLSDLLYIARMTTVGCILQRVLRMRPGIEGQWAGGLKLRKIVEKDVWYAARGRTLIASRSREALVRALTLTPEDRAEAGLLDGMIADEGAADARGVVRLEADAPLGRIFDAIHFAMQIDDAGGARVQIQAKFRPEWRERLSQIFRASGPAELQRPLEGAITMSGNFGVPVKELWLTLGELFGSETMSEYQWEDWETGREDNAAAAALTSLLGPTGPAFTLTWQGFDVYEMAPMPLIIGTVEADKLRVADFLEGLPGAPRTSAFHETLAYYDAETERFHAPMMSGPSMAPTAAWHGDGLLFSSSRRVAEAVMAQPPPATRTLEHAANLYIGIDPQASVRIITDTGRELAREGLLRDYTDEEYRKLSAEWIERARGVAEAEIWLTLAEDSALFDVYLKPGQDPAAPN